MVSGPGASHHLGTCQRCKYLGPAQTRWISSSGGGAQKPHFNKLSRWLSPTLTFQNDWPLGSYLQPNTYVCMSLPRVPRQSRLGIGTFHGGKNIQHHCLKQGIVARLSLTWPCSPAFQTTSLGAFHPCLLLEMFLWASDFLLAPKVILHVLSFWAACSGHLSWSLLVSSHLAVCVCVSIYSALSHEPLPALLHCKPVRNFPGCTSCLRDLPLSRLWVQV